MTKLDHDIAVKETLRFLSFKTKKPYEGDNVEEDYPSIFNAIKEGRLYIDEDNKPVYTLIEPINAGKEHSILEVTFKTRIKPTTKADLSDGLKLATQEAKFQLRLIAHMIGQHVVMLDNFCDEDYAVIQDICIFFIVGGR